MRGRHDGHYGARHKRRRKLDEHAVYLRERLERAGDRRLHATVLLRELRERGYDGGLTQLKDFLRVERPVAPVEPVVRFETPPGQQLQINFVVFRRGVSPSRAFTAELGYSRYPFVEFNTNERAETLIACLGQALFHFGGVADQLLCEKCAPDYMPLAVEQPFELRVGETTVIGAVDMIARDPDGTVVVIDYKTGRAASEKYALQTRALRAQARYPGEVVRSAILRLTPDAATFEEA